MFKQRRCRLLALFPLALGLNYLGGLQPQAVEIFYSRAIYPLIAQPISRVTGLLPFSLAEVLIVLLLLVSACGILWSLSRLLRGKLGLRSIVAFLRRAILTFSVVYFAFVAVWGLNYNRHTLATLTGLEVTGAPLTELITLCEELIGQANQLRADLPEDENGAMQLTGGKWRALSRAVLGYEQASARYPFLGGRYGAPKGVMLSRPWSYTGIGGMYVPFTAEANVNIAMPDVNIPATATHEMAHQRGFAREDEANFIAYLTCLAHPDQDFQYSGVFMALSYAMRAVRAQDMEAYNELLQLYGPGLKRDVIAVRTFWDGYEGFVRRTSSRVNDTYLKANQQRDGEQSYGRMVDLLLAQRRTK